MTEKFQTRTESGIIHNLLIFRAIMEYRPVPVSKFEEVLEFLRLTFPDEPLNVAVGLCKHGQKNELVEKYDLLTLQDGLSLMAVDNDNNQIAGVVLNGISRRGDVENELENMKSIDDIKYQRIFGLLYTVNASIDLFTKYNVDKIFELRILAVDNRYRGQGIARTLFEQSTNLATEQGFKLMKVDATSWFTQKIAEKLEFSVEKSVVYGDYKDENGQMIYDTPSPHENYSVMIKQLPSSKNDG